ncbi:MAG: hypothetical protein U0169_10660 [Polyangiaceae bacterium]
MGIRIRSWLGAWGFTALALAACGGGGSGDGDGTSDGGASSEGGSGDAGGADGATSIDAGGKDATTSDGGGVDGSTSDGGPIADGGADADGGMAELPFTFRTNGPVFAMHHAPGAWFFGGEFTAVNGTLLPRFGILSTDGAVKSGCDLGSGFEGTVNAIARSGNAWYVGGEFTKYKGQDTPGLVKIDATTCALDTTFTRVGSVFSGGRASVSAIAVSNGSVYVGGFFTGYRGVADAAMSIAKLDESSGALDTTFSPPGANANGFGQGYLVNALAVTADAVYVGGFLRPYRGQADVISHLAKLHPTTGVLDTTFSPPGANGFDGTVAALAVDGNSLYAAGGFNAYRSVGGSARRIAKLDRISGALDTTFTKHDSGLDGASPFVRALTVSGGSVFVGGEFESYRGVTDKVRNFAKLDATTGNLDTTFHSVTGTDVGFDGRVQAIAVSGSSVFVGGSFDAWRGVSRSGSSFAKLDASTGMLDTNFHPNGNTARGFAKDESVQALAANGTDLAVGGRFTHYAGFRAGGLAKVDDVRYELVPAFMGDGTMFDGDVYAFAASANALYVGGAFTGYRGTAQSARRFAKLDLTTGAIDTTFSPPGGTANGFEQVVSAVAVSGNSVYAGGYFTTYRGSANSANYLAKMDVTSGALDTAFSPPGTTANGFDQGVTALATAGTSLYVGGTFTAYRGEQDSARRLAKLDLVSGALDTTFSPPGATANGFDDDVNVLHVSGTSLLVGGGFDHYRGVQNSAHKVARVDLTTGALDAVFSPHGPNKGFDSDVYDFLVQGSSVYVVGQIEWFDGVPDALGGIAKLDMTTGALDTSFVMRGPGNGVDNSAYRIAAIGTRLLVAGEFRTYRGGLAPNLVRIDTNTGAQR